MNRKAEALKKRIALFATAIIELCHRVPKNQEGQTITRQLIEAATATNANYRAACRARTRPEFVAKIGLAREEADECCGWLELLVSSRLLTAADAQRELDEANQLTAILTASMLTARSRGRRIAKDAE